MRQMMLLILLSLFCCASIANNIQRHALETTDGEKTKEAIRLWLFYKPMQLMLSEPRISESDLQNGKQLMDRVRICEPVFETGLIYNSTIGKTVKMMDKFRSEQLIDNNVYTVMRDSLEEVTNFDKRIASSRGQYMITGNIFVVDTTIAQHDPKSISWSYTFCKVKVKGLTSQEQNDLARYMAYIQQIQWLQTSGPYCQLLLEKCIAYEKYLPTHFHIRF